MAAKTVSSYIPTGGAQVSRTVDALSWVFNSRPQAMTVYVKFIETGAVKNYAGGTTIIQLGSGNASHGYGPRFFVVPNSATSYLYRAGYHNGTAGVTSTLATGPAIGNVVELRATLSAAGVVRLHQSINGAAETSATASSAQALKQTWGSSALILNNHMAWLAIHVERGIHDLATMRQLAGVNKK